MSALQPAFAESTPVAASLSWESFKDSSSSFFSGMWKGIKNFGVGAKDKAVCLWNNHLSPALAKIWQAAKSCFSWIVAICKQHPVVASIVLGSFAAGVATGLFFGRCCCFGRSSNAPEISSNNQQPAAQRV